MSESHRPAGLARRALPALLLTGASVGLLSVLDDPTSAATLPSTGEVTKQPAVSSPSTVAPSTVAPTTVAASIVVATTAPSPTVPLAQVAPRVTVPVTTVPPVPGTCSGSTYDGTTVQTKWGPVQVRAVVSADGRVCDVRALSSPSDHQKSVQINQRALPILHDRAVAATTASFDAVSGATVTSLGYKQSLQAILDSVGR